MFWLLSWSFDEKHVTCNDLQASMDDRWRVAINAWRAPWATLKSTGLLYTKCGAVHLAMMCTAAIARWYCIKNIRILLQTSKIIDVTFYLIILPPLEMQLQRAGSAAVPHAIPGCRPLEHARQAINRRCAPKKRRKEIIKPRYVAVTYLVSAITILSLLLFRLGASGRADIDCGWTVCRPRSKFVSTTYLCRHGCWWGDVETWFMWFKNDFLSFLY